MKNPPFVKSSNLHKIAGKLGGLKRALSGTSFMGFTFDRWANYSLAFP